MGWWSKVKKWVKVGAEVAEHVPGPVGIGAEIASDVMNKSETVEGIAKIGGKEAGIGMGVVVGMDAVKKAKTAVAKRKTTKKTE